MIRCYVCGTTMRHNWEGKYDAETGQFVCSGCYAPELHPDLNDDYETTDKTAHLTDIGEVE